MNKTNALRELDLNHIAYTPYEYDENIVDGVGVAKALGEDPDSVFKSIVCVNEKKEHFIFEVPVAHSIDLKKAAHYTNSKWVELIPYKELLPLTGYIHGGCSPIGLKKAMPVYIDETALLFDKIYISGGKRGLQVCLSPKDLVAFLKAQVKDIVLWKN